MQRALTPRICLPRHTRTASSTSHLQLCRLDTRQSRTGTAASTGSCHRLVGRCRYVRLVSVSTSASVEQLPAFRCASSVYTTLPSAQELFRIGLPRAQYIHRQKAGQTVIAEQ